MTRTEHIAPRILGVSGNKIMEFSCEPIAGIAARCGVLIERICAMLGPGKAPKVAALTGPEDSWLGDARPGAGQKSVQRT